MNRLDTTTARRSDFDLDLPLHPDTDNSEHVALMVQGILDGIDRMTIDTTVTDRDLVQALTIATAVRAALARLGKQGGRALTLDLLDVRVAEPVLN